MAYTKYLYLFLLFHAVHAATVEPDSLCFPKEDFQSSNESLNAANTFFEAGLYTKAIDAYNHIIDNENDPYLLMQSRFHLAQIYFSTGNYQEAISVLNENLAPNQEESLNWHSLYLKALALKHLGEQDSAKKTFLAYVHSKAISPLPFYEEALFEIALIDFQHERYEDAEKTLKFIKNKPRLYALSQLYLARIKQIQNHHVEAAEILHDIRHKMEPDDPLSFEFNYLQGKTAFQMQNYHDAIASFKKALPLTSTEEYPWYTDTLSHLGWSYFKLANRPGQDSIQQNEYLKHAEEVFDRLLAISKDENSALALTQCYLLMSPEYVAKAEALLSRPNLFHSKDAKAHALLLRAEAAPSYSARDHFYRQLIEEPNDSIFYAQGWYMRALNDFEYGQQLEEQNEDAAAQSAFERSAKAFEKSFELLQEKDPQQAGAALKYQALATANSTDSDANVKALQILDNLLKHPQIGKVLPNRDEIDFLRGYFSGKAADGLEKEKYLEIARNSLLAAASTPDSLFGDQALNYLGALYYKNEDYGKAEEAYLKLTKTYPASPLAAEAWVWAASCADHLQVDSNTGKERRKYAYDHFPNSPFGAEAFFTYYTYPEYLQGDREAIKHLQTFTEKYTESPFLIDAHYLMGLDYKRDRKTEEGRWIRKKSLTDAIDSFQKVEILFDELSEKIPPEKMDYYTAMRYRATLERAMGNLAIANEAQGAKQQIYLNYAEEVFKNLISQANLFPALEEECCFGLAQTYIKANKDDEAELTLAAITDKYNKINTVTGYYLSRTRAEQGSLAMRKKEYQKALDHFRMAEEAAKGNVLSTDQRLDLWIQESFAYRGLGQFDDAILILSKVVNDDAVSSLRMKAMFLRAEVYELQNRPELAHKQLESMVKKGGLWARKAQEKLELSYGH